MKCAKCDYEWNYKGKSKYYAQCPMCRIYNNMLHDGARWTEEPVKK